jgi:hypothetical protein
VWTTWLDGLCRPARAPPQRQPTDGRLSDEVHTGTGKGSAAVMGVPFASVRSSLQKLCSLLFRVLPKGLLQRRVPWRHSQEVGNCISEPRQIRSITELFEPTPARVLIKTYRSPLWGEETLRGLGNDDLCVSAGSSTNKPNGIALLMCKFSLIACWPNSLIARRARRAASSGMSYTRVESLAAEGNSLLATSVSVMLLGLVSASLASESQEPGHWQ